MIKRGIELRNNMNAKTNDANNFLGSHKIEVLNLKYLRFEFVFGFRASEFEFVTRAHV